MDNNVVELNLRSLQQEEVYACYCKHSQLPMAREVLDPKGEHYIAIFLEQYNF